MGCFSASDATHITSTFTSVSNQISTSLAALTGRRSIKHVASAARLRRPVSSAYALISPSTFRRAISGNGMTLSGRSAGHSTFRKAAFFERSLMEASSFFPFARCRLIRRFIQTGVASLGI